MKDILAYWIFIQLIMIGWIGGTIINKIANDTYECPRAGATVSRFAAATFPLTVFIPEQRIITDYCDNQPK